MKFKKIIYLQVSRKSSPKLQGWNGVLGENKVIVKYITFSEITQFSRYQQFCFSDVLVLISRKGHRYLGKYTK